MHRAIHRPTPAVVTRCLAGHEDTRGDEVGVGRLSLSTGSGDLRKRSGAGAPRYWVLNLRSHWPDSGPGRSIDRRPAELRGQTTARGTIAASFVTRGERMGSSRCIKCECVFELGGRLQFMCPACHPAEQTRARAKTRPTFPPPMPAASPSRTRPGLSRAPGRSGPLPRLGVGTTLPRGKSLASIVSRLDRGGRPTAQGRIRAVPVRQRVCRICGVSPPMANADVCYSCNPE